MNTGYFCMCQSNRKRFYAFILAIVLLLLTAVPVYAASSATAADMRLAKTEGTVTLTNNTGRTLSVRDNMKLYSGYTVATSAESYAWLQLDNEKAVKLDANSAMEVRKKGKKLELLVTDGQIFFDVKNPLDEGETMNIRTSTMVTGIRGTAGYVTVSGDTASVTLLEGIAEVLSIPSGTTVTVTAGQTGHANPATAFVEPMGETAGFVDVELASDASLAERVAEALGEPVDALVANAQEKLANDERQAAKAADDARVQLNRVNAQSNIAGSELISDQLMAEILATGTVTEPGSSPAPTPSPSPSEPAVTGKLTLAIALKDNNGKPLAVDTDTTYNGTVTDTNGVTTSVDINVPAGANTGTVTLPDLALGTYTVSVASIGTLTIGGAEYVCQTAAADETVEITKDALEPTLTRDIVYTLVPPATGSLTVNISLVEQDARSLTTANAKSFTCTVTNTDTMTEYSLPVTINVNQGTGTAVLNDLPLGTYTVALPATKNDTLASGEICLADTTAVSASVTTPNLNPSADFTIVYNDNRITTMLSAADVNTIFTQYDTVEIIDGGSVTMESGDTLTVASKKYLDVRNNGILINNGTLDISTGGHFTTQSGSSFTNDGTINIHGTWDNESTNVTLNESGTVHVYTTFNNKADLTSYNHIILEPGASFNNGLGTTTPMLYVDGGLTIKENAILTDNGGVMIGYSFASQPIDITIEAGGSFITHNTVTTYTPLYTQLNITVYGTFELASDYSAMFIGTDFVLKKDANASIGGKLIVNGKTSADPSEDRVGLNIDGTLTIDANCTLINNGAVTIRSGRCINNGTIENSGTFVNEETFTNNGSFTGTGTYSNNGTGTVDGTNAGQVTAP